MRWLQRWLGQLYSLLFSSFERQDFTFSEAISASAMSEPKLSVAFSKLHAGKALIVFGRSRPRRYRLLDPRSLLLLTSNLVKPANIKQEQYLQLIYDTFRRLYGQIDLVSFALYGSVVRETAAPSSDLDILLISKSFRGSLASRIDSLAWVEREVKVELNFLSSQGYRPFISFYPLRLEEAERLPILFLDLTEEARIMYDREDFLANILAQFRAKLQLKGARRVAMNRAWYWDLKPDYRFGEVIEV